MGQISKYNDLHLDLTQGFTNDGTNVQVFEGNGTDAQIFIFRDAYAPDEI